MQFIMNKYGLDIDAMLNILNKKSGVLGVSGVSSDFRDLESAAEEGNERARLALDMFDYSVAKVVGSYVAAMNGVDAIIFTAGVGENAPTTRAGICQYLGYLGCEIDEAANARARQATNRISTDSSRVQLWGHPHQRGARHRPRHPRTSSPLCERHKKQPRRPPQGGGFFYSVSHSSPASAEHSAGAAGGGLCL